MRRGFTTFQMQEGVVSIHPGLIEDWKKLDRELKLYYLHKFHDRLVRGSKIHRDSLTALHDKLDATIQRVINMLRADPLDFARMAQHYYDGIVQNEELKILYVLLLADLIDRRKVPSTFNWTELFAHLGLVFDSQHKHDPIYIVVDLYRWAAHQQCWAGVGMLARCIATEVTSARREDFNFLDLIYSPRSYSRQQATRLLQWSPIANTSFALAELAGLCDSNQKKKRAYERAAELGSARALRCLGYLAQERGDFVSARDHYLAAITAGDYAAISAVATLVETGEVLRYQLKMLFELLGIKPKINEKMATPLDLHYNFQYAACLYEVALLQGQQISGLEGLTKLIAARRIALEFINFPLNDLNDVEFFIAKNSLLCTNQYVGRWLLKAMLPLFLKKSYDDIPPNLCSFATLHKEYLVEALCAVSAQNFLEHFEVNAEAVLDHRVALAVILDSTRNNFLPDFIELPGVTDSSKVVHRHLNLNTEGQLDLTKVPGLLGEAMRIKAGQATVIESSSYSLTQIDSLIKMHPTLFTDRLVLPWLLEVLLPLFLQARSVSDVPTDLFQFVVQQKSLFVGILLRKRDQFHAEKDKLIRGASACAAVIDTARGFSSFFTQTTKSRRRVGQVFFGEGRLPASGATVTLFYEATQPSRDTTSITGSATNEKVFAQIDDCQL